MYEVTLDAPRDLQFPMVISTTLTDGTVSALFEDCLPDCIKHGDYPFASTFSIDICKDDSYASLIRL